MSATNNFILKQNVDLVKTKELVECGKKIGCNTKGIMRDWGHDSSITNITNINTKCGKKFGDQTALCRSCSAYHDTLMTQLADYSSETHGLVAKHETTLVSMNDTAHDNELQHFTPKPATNRKDPDHRIVEMQPLNSSDNHNEKTVQQGRSFLQALKDHKGKIAIAIGCLATAALAGAITPQFIGRGIEGKSNATCRSELGKFGFSNEKGECETRNIVATDCSSAQIFDVDRCRNRVQSDCDTLGKKLNIYGICRDYTQLDCDISKQKLSNDRQCRDYTQEDCTPLGKILGNNKQCRKLTNEERIADCHTQNKILDTTTKECRDYNQTDCQDRKQTLGDDGQCRDYTQEDCDKSKQILGTNQQCRNYTQKDCNKSNQILGTDQQCRNYTQEDCDKSKQILGTDQQCREYTLQDCISLGKILGENKQCRDLTENENKAKCHTQNQVLDKDTGLCRDYNQQDCDNTNQKLGDDKQCRDYTQEDCNNTNQKLDNNKQCRDYTQADCDNTNQKLDNNKQCRDYTNEDCEQIGQILDETKQCRAVKKEDCVNTAKPIFDDASRQCRVREEKDCIVLNKELGSDGECKTKTGDSSSAGTLNVNEVCNLPKLHFSAQSGNNFTPLFQLDDITLNNCTLSNNFMFDTKALCKSDPQIWKNGDARLSLTCLDTSDVFTVNELRDQRESVLKGCKNTSGSKQHATQCEIIKRSEKDKNSEKPSAPKELLCKGDLHISADLIDKDILTVTAQDENKKPLLYFTIMQKGNLNLNCYMDLNEVKKNLVSAGKNVDLSRAKTLGVNVYRGGYTKTVYLPSNQFHDMAITFPKNDFQFNTVTKCNRGQKSNCLDFGLLA